MTEKYRKHELHSHILDLPGMYIGNVAQEQTETAIYNNNIESFEKKVIQYIPGLYKIVDEILVNASDHATRLLSSTEPDVKPVKNIKVSIDKETGEISVWNDGDGIDIIEHPEYNNIYVPSLIFSELLTSTNYNKEEERIVGGMNGLGAKLTNIYSTKFVIETVDHRRGKLFKQTFQDNMYKKGKPSVTSTSKAPYTKITFTPDYARFGLTELSDDFFNLFKKRCYDLCAVTHAGVSVYFNGTKINIKDFEKYADMYLGDKKEQPRVYEKVNDRWEVLVSTSDNGFNQVSFVNGIFPFYGGTHVQYVTNQITKKLMEMAEKKKKTVKSNHIKENLYVFVKCSVVNPAFNSQSKENLTTPVSKFGSKCELSDTFMTKLYKTGIVDKASALTSFHDEKKLVKTDGKKTSKVIIPMLDDAQDAGGKNSHDCTLILTEGLSAKGMAVNGLSVIGRQKWGIFPLQGKILNVKDVSTAKLNENKEIANLKKIIGLEHNKKYEDITSLRYGKIMLLVDGDDDGSHIKSLLVNLFQTQWPSLYQKEGFLCTMLTPIVKVKNSSGKEISFYSHSDYKNWCETEEAKKNKWKTKYIKGLGTNSSAESQEYFKEMKKVEYKYNEKSDEAIELAFNKKRADDRKQWLMSYDKNNILDHKQQVVTYDDLINKELIHFSNRDLSRSIPNVVDGLKESIRKIIFACFKKKLYNDELKVAQLGAYVAEQSMYHHGETSLFQTITNMAQKFVGSNNIPLLEDRGNFGSRIFGGSDAASPRYIYTLISKLCRLVFREADFDILTYKVDEGYSIEPEYYIGIIPFALINNIVGIGTGYSCTVPSFNPTDVINQCKLICNMMEKENIDVTNSDDLLKAFAVINKTHFNKLVPYYLGFKGQIIEKDGKFISKGIYTVDDNILTITELPIFTWTDDYKTYLEELLQNNKIKDFDSHYTAKNVKFVIKLLPNYNTQNIETDFKLTSSRNLGTTNFHLFNPYGTITKYDTTIDIVKEWSSVRVTKYLERKQYQLNLLEKEYEMINAKVKFILDVISGKIKIMNVPNGEINDRLIELKYPKIGENDESKSYNYLLNMPISQLTKEKKEKLEKEAEKLKMEIEKLKKTPIYKIWMNELEELEEEWNKYQKEILEDYVKDLESYEKTMNKSSKKKK